MLRIGAQSWIYYWVTDGQGQEFAVGDSMGRQSAPDASSRWRYAGATKVPDSFDSNRQSDGGVRPVSYFRNRAYDQQTGRWTQEDPIGIAGGLNLYQFNGNDPVTNSDPFGLLAESCCNLGLVDPSAVMVGTPGIAREEWNKRAEKLSEALVIGSLAPGGSEGKVAGSLLKGFTKHGIDQAISREGVGVATEAIRDALKNPTKVVAQSKGTMKYIGENATVVLNKLGKVVTTWARNSLGWRMKP